ncbi:MAG: short-chain dehydrogenase [Rhodobacteraceae bacterium]|nr:short-chain dehydrogenase [Paracoccaceae bacterium]
MKKNIVITGCSSGIGRDAAITLASKGWRVLATCRSASDCKYFEKIGIESFPLDLSDEHSISSAVEIIAEKTSGMLDAIFNNGAFAIPGAIEDLPRSAMREIFEVNVFGQFDLINRCLPLMLNTKDPRIINCSSVLGFISLPYRGVYSATKFALEALTDAMRRENYNVPIKIILLQPGPINTQIRKNSIPHFKKWVRWNESNHKEVYRDIVIKRLNGNTSYDLLNKFELQPNSVTAVLEKALLSKNPKSRYLITRPTLAAKIMVTIFPTRVLDWMFKI